jgi:hypothetical protein
VPVDTERLLLHQAARLAVGGIGVGRVVAAEGGGLRVEAREGTDALDRLAARGVLVRRMMEPDTGYVPPPTGLPGRTLVAVLEASLRDLVARLAPRPSGPASAGGPPGGPASPPSLGAPPRVSSRR